MKPELQESLGKMRGVLFFKIGLAIALLWQLSFLGYRLWAVWDRGDVNLTTGGEENPAYAVWRLVNGYSLYTDPDARPYVLNIYNFLFYYTHAGVAKLFQLNGPELLLCGRSLSFLFTLVGLAASIGILLKFGRVRGNKGFIAAAAFLALTWLSYDTLGWLAVSIRPDAMATSLAMAGLFFYLIWNEKEKVSFLILSLVLFSCAASVKQSIFGIFGGCFVHNLMIPSRRKWIILFIIFPLAFVLCAYLTQGMNWWLNIFKAPGATMSQVNGLPIRALTYSAVTNVYLWIPFLYLSLCLAFWLRTQKNVYFQWKHPASIVFICGVISFLAAVLALARNGSTSNHLLEFYFSSGLLAAFWISGRVFWRSWPRQASVLPCLALLLVAAQVLSIKNFFLHKVGPICSERGSDVELKRDFVRWYQSLPRPGLVVCSMYSLPWFSGDLKGEAYIYDPTYHPLRLKTGNLVGAGYTSLVEGQEIGSLLLSRKDPLGQMALEKGYQEIEIPERFRRIEVGWAGIDSQGSSFGSALADMKAYTKPLSQNP